MELKYVLVVLSMIMALCNTHEEHHFSTKEEYVEKVCPTLRIDPTPHNIINMCRTGTIYGNNCDKKRTKLLDCRLAECYIRPDVGMVHGREVEIVQDECPQYVKTRSCSYPNKYCMNAEQMKYGCCETVYEYRRVDVWYHDERDENNHHGHEHGEDSDTDHHHEMFTKGPVMVKMPVDCNCGRIFPF